MKGLRRDVQRWHDGRDTAERGAREQLKFIMANLESLRKADRKGNHERAARSMNAQKERLTPKQLSYIDDIYEKVMKGAGFGSFTPTYKPKRKLI